MALNYSQFLTIKDHLEIEDPTITKPTGGRPPRAIFNVGLSHEKVCELGWKSPKVHLYLPPMLVRFHSEKFGTYIQAGATKENEATYEFFEKIYSSELDLVNEIKNEWSKLKSVSNIIRLPMVTDRGHITLDMYQTNNNITYRPEDLYKGLFTFHTIGDTCTATAGNDVKIAVLKTHNETVPAYTVSHDPNDLCAIQQTCRVVNPDTLDLLIKNSGESTTPTAVHFEYGAESARIGDIIAPIIRLDHIAVSEKRVELKWTLTACEIIRKFDVDQSLVASRDLFIPSATSGKERFTCFDDLTPYGETDMEVTSGSK